MFTPETFLYLVTAVGVVSLIICARSLLRQNYSLWVAGAILIFIVAACAFPVSMYKKRAQIHGDWRVSFIPISVFLLGVVAALSINWGFSDEDISVLKSEIAKEYEGRGATSVEVEMIRDGSIRLVGFAKINIEGFSVTRKCSATMSSSDSMYIWSCD